MSGQRATLTQVLAGSAAPLELTSAGLLDWAVQTGRVAAGARASWRSRFAQATTWPAEAAVRQALVGMTPAQPPVPAATVSAAWAAGRAVAAAAGGKATERPSRFNGKPVIVDDFARNPLVDDLRQANPGVYAAATADGPAPTLFSAGDLPVMTASGIEPAELLRLPWFARHAAAVETDRGQLTAMFEDAATPDGPVYLATYGAAGGALEYEARVQRWAMGR